MTITDCTAALLCGGKSSRMGFDKARLQDDNGGFLLPQNLEKLGGAFAAVALVAAQGQSLAGKKYSTLYATETSLPCANP